MHTIKYSTLTQQTHLWLHIDAYRGDVGTDRVDVDTLGEDANANGRDGNSAGRYAQTGGAELEGRNCKQMFTCSWTLLALTCSQGDTLS